MRPTYAQIDLIAIRHNIRKIQETLNPSTGITAVVKANAYGHGVVPVARAALEAGASSLAVAIPEEGVELRHAGFTEPILILGLTLPEQAPLIVAHNLTATVATKGQLDGIAAAGRQLNQKARIMIKVDTGMNRIGVTPDRLLEFAADAAGRSELELRGLFTHLATADAADKEYANKQLALFRDALDKLAKKNISLPFISAANSAGAIDLPEGHFNTVRPGIAIYGLQPSNEMQHHLSLRPAMKLVSKIVYVKEVPAGASISYGCTYNCPASTWLATLPVGYADGYSRHLSNRGVVLINGKKRPVVGRVCMDQIIVDIGPVCDVEIGDEAVLFGRQGNEEITVTELASLAGTINYELLCAISSRVPRVYLG